MARKGLYQGLWRWRTCWWSVPRFSKCPVWQRQHHASRSGPSGPSSLSLTSSLPRSWEAPAFATQSPSFANPQMQARIRTWREKVCEWNNTIHCAFNTRWTLALEEAWKIFGRRNSIFKVPPERKSPFSSVYRTEGPANTNEDTLVDFGTPMLVFKNQCPLWRSDRPTFLVICTLLMRELNQEKHARVTELCFQHQSSLHTTAISVVNGEVELDPSKVPYLAAETLLRMFELTMVADGSRTKSKTLQDSSKRGKELQTKKSPIKDQKAPTSLFAGWCYYYYSLTRASL